MVNYILAVFAVIFSAAALISMKKSGHFIRSLLLSAVQGTASLLAVNAAAIFTGVNVNVNAFSVASGVLFGTPGVIFHIIAPLIIK